MIDSTLFQNKKAAYYTLGCKLNFAETSTIGKLLAEEGIRRVRPGETADICVINTCSVTELADKKCRQAIRRIGKEHPGAFIVVTGCYAQLKPEEVAHIEGVDLVTEGVLTLSRTVDILRDYLNKEADSFYFHRLDEENGAAMIAKMLLEECTDLHVFIGKAINPAHQNPGLPSDLSIKMKLIDELCELVKKLGKNVEKVYY